MELEIFDVAEDKVIESYVATGRTTYSSAINYLYPLIDRFFAQRKKQDKKFYKRLERDLLNGCLMPPITIAFVDEENTSFSTPEKLQRYVTDNISNGYILDGMQRLNTLNNASLDENFNSLGLLYANIIISPSRDKLLYRMITLNNGQRPMTPRHQIEVLTQELFNFDNLKNITVQTEKERGEKIIQGSFDVGDISKAYLSFLTNNVHNENNKIIDEKMDQILVNRILDTDISKGALEFTDVLTLIDQLSIDEVARTWLKVNNNLIGFTVGIKTSLKQLKDCSPEKFAKATSLFDEAFKMINVSKVNLGKFRRELSCKFIQNFATLSVLDLDDLQDFFFELTVT